MSKSIHEHHFKRTVAGVIGNVLEWYDFAVFGYFAPIIASQFFPEDDPVAGLINAFGVFAAGYLMRPLGGVVFGYIGDKLGRKRALGMSVMLMVIPTTLLGLLPTHAQVGIVAPIMLLILRLVQGFSVGGELIGSISDLTEVAPPGRRGFLGSFAFFGAVGGVLLGSLVATLAHLFLDAEFLQTWGWRIPFLFGFLVGVFGLWMRKGLAESPDFEREKAKGSMDKNPVAEVIKKMPLRIIHLVALIVVNAGGFYTIFVWWPTYLTKIIKPSIDHAFTANTISMIVFMLLLPLFGWLSDRLGRKRLMMTGLLGFVIFTYPLFLWTDQGVFSHAIITQLVFAFFLSLSSGPLAATMVEMFPIRMRFSGIALGYNVAQSLFGGTAPLICTWLISETADITSPAYFITSLGVVSLIAAFKLNSKYGDSAVYK